MYEESVLITLTLSTHSSCPQRIIIKYSNLTFNVVDCNLVFWSLSFENFFQHCSNVTRILSVTHITWETQSST